MATPRAVAARHDIYPNLLGTWRGQVRRAQLVSAQARGLVPVRIVDGTASAPSRSAELSVPASSQSPLPDSCHVRGANQEALAAPHRGMATLRG